MGKWERTLNAHSDTVTALAFSHHGQFLVSGSKDQTIRIWNTNDYPSSEILTAQARQITDLKITQNDHLLISSSLDGMIQIWDLETKSIIQTIDNENQSILSLAINSHLNIFATANHQVTQLWDLQTGKLLQTLSGCHPITFSPDGKILVTGTQTKKKILKIWRYSSKYFETESVQQFDPSQAWWEILGVSPHSDPQEIKMAYYCLAKQFHPDQNPTEEAIESMKIINQAYRQFRNRNPSPTHN